MSEEERTKQEGLRLEVRRTELEMMREAMRGGMNPSLVPFMFAGSIGISTRTADFIKDQMAEFLNQHAPQQLFPGQELRRETRSIAQPSRQGYDQKPPLQGQGQIMAPPAGAPRDAPYSQQPYNPPLAITAPPRVSSQQALQQPFSAQQQQPAPAPSQQQVRPRGHTLPHLSMTEVQQHQPSFQVGPPSQPPPQQQQQQPPPQYPPPSTSETTPATQAPFIFFHHYVPPGQQGSSSSGHRSSPPRHLDSPFGQHHSHVTGPETAASPKKRKSTSTQPQQPPPPTTTNSSFSPIFSTITPSGRRRGHSRPRSDSTSAIGQDRYSRQQPSRQRRSDGGYAPIDGGPSHSDRDLPPTSAPPHENHPQAQMHPSQQAPPPPQHQQQQQGPYEPHPGHQQLPPMHPHSRPPSDQGLPGLLPARPYEPQSRLQSPGPEIRRQSHAYPEEVGGRGRMGSGGSAGDEGR